MAYHVIVALIMPLISADVTYSDVNYSAPIPDGSTWTSIIQAQGLVNMPAEATAEDASHDASTLPDKENSVVWSALHVSAHAGDVSTTALLLRNGARADLDAGDGVTPLHAAALTGSSGAITILLDYGMTASSLTQRTRTRT